MGLGVAECFAAAGIRVVLTDATPESYQAGEGQAGEAGEGSRRSRAALGRGGRKGRGGRDRRRRGGCRGRGRTRLRGRTGRHRVEGGDPGFLLGGGAGGCRYRLEHFFAADKRPRRSSWNGQDDSAACTGSTRRSGRPASRSYPPPRPKRRSWGGWSSSCGPSGSAPPSSATGPGFVANRIQNALFLEAVRCVEEGLASPQEVDEVVRSCFGFRLPFFGPFQVADMAGLDVYENVLDVLEGRPRRTLRGPRLATRPRRTGAHGHQEWGRLPRVHGRRAGAVAPGARPAIRRVERAPERACRPSMRGRAP